MSKKTCSFNSTFKKKTFKCFSRETILKEYNNYLIRDLGLASTSMKQYCRRVNTFLQYLFGSKCIKINLISQKHIINFILHCLEKLTPQSIQSYSTGIRHFFRFLNFKYKLVFDLSNSVLPIAVKKPEHLPDFLNEHEIKLLLKTCDKRSAIGKRNYAILMLLTRLGIRADGICNISLDDIDWSNGEILIKQKGKKALFPISQDLGDCLVAYLVRARPNCASKRFFLQSKPPYKELQTRDISSVVRTALKHTNLIPQKKGTHLLRHSFAMLMLHKGASLQEIAEILGHQSINTTAIYARIDFNKLSELALPWPKKLKFGGTV